MAIGQGDLDMGLEIYTAQAQNRLLVRREVFADFSLYVKCSMLNTELNQEDHTKDKAFTKKENIPCSSLLRNQRNFEGTCVCIPAVNWGVAFSDKYSRRNVAGGCSTNTVFNNSFSKTLISSYSKI